MTFFTGTGRHRAQIIYFFGGRIGSRAPSGLGLGSGGRLRRMRRCLGLSRELWMEIFGKSWSRAIERKGPCLYVCTDGSRRACGVGACARLVATLGAPRETSGPRFDRISLARPPCGLVASAPRNYFWPPGSVALISLDQWRTEGYSDGCVSCLLCLLVSYRPLAALHSHARTTSYAGCHAIRRHS